MKTLEIELPNKERLMMVEVENPVDVYDLKYPSPTMDRSGTVMLVERIGGARKYLMKVGIEKEAPEILGFYSPQSGIDFPEKVKEEWVEQIFDGKFGSYSGQHAKLREQWQSYGAEKTYMATKEDSFLSLLKHHSEKQWTLKQAEPLIAWMEEGKEIQSNIGENESKVMPSRFICLLIR